MKKIILMAIPLLLLVLAFSTANNFKVTGKVTDDRGQAVPFATITEKKTRNAIKANADGVFVITVSSEKAILIFTAVGFESKEIAVNGSSSINTTLVAVGEIKEVVVTTQSGVGYDKSPAQLLVDNSYSWNARNKPLQGSVSFSTSRISSWTDQPKNGSYDSTRVFNTEEYEKIVDNPFLRVVDNPLSTFSIDVDAASYSNVRRFLNSGQLPPAGAVRIEEMINYFHYEYPQPEANDPFIVNTEISDCP